MKKTIAEMLQSASTSAAAEKLIKLFDEDSFVELDKFVGKNKNTAGVISGYGFVDGAVVYAYAQDTSVKSGATDESAALKIKKVYDLALKNGAPVVSILDSKGGDIAEGMKLLAAYGDIAKSSAALSGAVPQIAIVDGVCAGTNAMIACMADIVIMTEKSELFMTAPFVADDKTEGAGTAENAAKSGVATIIAKDGDEAIAKAKKLIAMLPANNLETAGNDYYTENDAVVTEDLKGLELISAVADKDSITELYNGFGSAAVTAIGSVNWRTVGFVATNGAEYLNNDDSAKIARFVTLCDAFSIPVVTFVDTKGYEKSSAAELAGSIRNSAKLMQTYASATTAKIAVITGNAYGSAYVSFASTAAGSDFCFAWEDAVIAPVSPEAAVTFLNGAASAEDTAKAAKEYAENEADPFTAASLGYVDRVIEVADTKSAITSAIDVTASKRVLAPAKKHVNFVF